MTSGGTYFVQTTFSLSTNFTDSGTYAVSQTGHESDGIYSRALTATAQGNLNQVLQYDRENKQYTLDGTTKGQESGYSKVVLNFTNNTKLSSGDRTEISHSTFSQTTIDTLDFSNDGTWWTNGTVHVSDGTMTLNTSRVTNVVGRAWGSESRPHFTSDYDTKHSSSVTEVANQTSQYKLTPGVNVAAGTYLTKTTGTATAKTASGWTDTADGATVSARQTADQKSERIDTDSGEFSGPLDGTTWITTYDHYAKTETTDWTYKFSDQRPGTITIHDTVSASGNSWSSNHEWSVLPVVRTAAGKSGEGAYATASFNHSDSTVKHSADGPNYSASNTDRTIVTFSDQDSGTFTLTVTGKPTLTGKFSRSQLIDRTSESKSADTYSLAGLSGQVTGTTVHASKSSSWLSVQDTSGDQGYTIVNDVVTASYGKTVLDSKISTYDTITVNESSSLPPGTSSGETRTDSSTTGTESKIDSSTTTTYNRNKSGATIVGKTETSTDVTSWWHKSWVGTKVEDLSLINKVVALLYGLTGPSVFTTSFDGHDKNSTSMLRVDHFDYQTSGTLAPGQERNPNSTAFEADPFTQAGKGTLTISIESSNRSRQSRNAPDFDNYAWHGLQSGAATLTETNTSKGTTNKSYSFTRGPNGSTEEGTFDRVTDAKSRKDYASMASYVNNKNTLEGTIEHNSSGFAQAVTSTKEINGMYETATCALGLPLSDFTSANVDRVKVGTAKSVAIISQDINIHHPGRVVIEQGEITTKTSTYERESDQCKSTIDNNKEERSGTETTESTSTVETNGYWFSGESGRAERKISFRGEVWELAKPATTMKQVDIAWQGKETYQPRLEVVYDPPGVEWQGTFTYDAGRTEITQETSTSSRTETMAYTTSETVPGTYSKTGSGSFTETRSSNHAQRLIDHSNGYFSGQSIAVSRNYSHKAANSGQASANENGTFEFSNGSTKSNSFRKAASTQQEMQTTFVSASHNYDLAWDLGDFSGSMSGSGSAGGRSSTNKTRQQTDENHLTITVDAQGETVLRDGTATHSEMQVIEASDSAAHTYNHLSTNHRLPDNEPYLVSDNQSKSGKNDISYSYFSHDILVFDGASHKTKFFTQESTSQPWRTDHSFSKAELYRISEWNKYTSGSGFYEYVMNFQKNLRIGTQDAKNTIVLETDHKWINVEKRWSTEHGIETKSYQYYPGCLEDILNIVWNTLVSHLETALDWLAEQWAKFGDAILDVVQAGLQIAAVFAPPGVATALALANLAISAARGAEITLLDIAMAAMPSLGMAKLAKVSMQATRTGAAARTAIHATNVVGTAVAATNVYSEGREALVRFANGDFIGGLQQMAGAALNIRGVKAGLRSAKTLTIGDYSPCQKQRLRPWTIDQSVCFAGDMLVLTRERGAVRWDDLHVGEEVWSQDEFDPKAPGAWKRVEEIFSTEAIVCTLRVAEQEIKTTAEHPFWVEGRGWTAVKELQPGDRLRGHDGQLYPVESVTATDEWVPVFNCRIAEYHTYYICAPGGSAWLWAHNRCEKHHAAFKYVLRGVNKYVNGTTKLTKLRQNLVKLDPEVHKNLHKIFDKMNGGKYRRNLGWDNIYDKLEGRKVTPATLFDKMEYATKKALRGMPELEQTLGELARIRGLLNIT